MLHKNKLFILIFLLLPAFFLSGCGTQITKVVQEDALTFSGETENWQAKVVQYYSKQSVHEKQEGNDSYDYNEDNKQYFWVKYKGNPKDIGNGVGFALEMPAGRNSCSCESINDYGYSDVRCFDQLADRNDKLELTLDWGNTEQIIHLNPDSIEQTETSAFAVVSDYLHALKDGNLEQVYQCTNYLQFPWEYWKTQNEEKIRSKFNYIERFYLGRITFSQENESNSASAEAQTYFMGKDGRTFQAAAELLKLNGQWVVQNFTVTKCSIPNSLRVFFADKTPFPIAINCSPGVVFGLKTDMWSKKNVSSMGCKVDFVPHELGEKLFYGPHSNSTQNLSLEQMREILKKIKIVVTGHVGEKEFGPVYLTYEDIYDMHKFYAEPVYGW